MSRRLQPVALALAVLHAGCGGRGNDAATRSAAREHAVRTQLEARYRDIASALETRDLGAFQALRTPGFRSLDPRGHLLPPDQMAARSKLLLSTIEPPIHVEFQLDSVTVRGDTAITIVVQHFVRRQTLAGSLHDVDTSARQREWWIRDGSAWKLDFVDAVHPLVWKVDGEVVDPVRGYQPRAAGSDTGTAPPQERPGPGH